MASKEDATKRTKTKAKTTQAKGKSRTKVEASTSKMKVASTTAKSSSTMKSKASTKRTSVKTKSSLKAQNSTLKTKSAAKAKVNSKSVLKKTKTISSIKSTDKVKPTVKRKVVQSSKSSRSNTKKGTSVSSTSSTKSNMKNKIISTERTSTDKRTKLLGTHKTKNMKVPAVKSMSKDGNDLLSRSGKQATSIPTVVKGKSKQQSKHVCEVTNKSEKKPPEQKSIDIVQGIKVEPKKQISEKTETNEERQKSKEPKKNVTLSETAKETPLKSSNSFWRSISDDEWEYVYDEVDLGKYGPAEKTNFVKLNIYNDIKSIEPVRDNNSGQPQTSFFVYDHDFEVEKSNPMRVSMKPQKKNKCEPEKGSASLPVSELATPVETKVIYNSSEVSSDQAPKEKSLTVLVPKIASLMVQSKASDVEPSEKVKQTQVSESEQAKTNPLSEMSSDKAEEQPDKSNSLGKSPPKASIDTLTNVVSTELDKFINTKSPPADEGKKFDGDQSPVGLTNNSNMPLETNEDHSSTADMIEKQKTQSKAKSPIISCQVPASGSFSNLVNGHLNVRSPGNKCSTGPTPPKKSPPT